MTGPEMIEELERQEYYKERERKNEELVDCYVWLVKIILVGGGLVGLFRLLFG